MLLAGDIGGTKTRLAMIDPDQGAHHFVVEKVYKSRDYDGLEAIIAAFYEEVEEEKFERASFGVAGPVVEGRADITNLAWTMDEEKLVEVTGIGKVTLLNDLQATAYGVLVLDPDEIHTLIEGNPVAHSAIAVIAPGTGLGQSFLTYHNGQYIAHPSEGGHTDFAPLNQQQANMLLYLLEKYAHVSYEWVCSGIGIPNIYAFLKDSGFAEEPDWFAQQLAEAKDPTPLIADAAFGDDALPLCVETMNVFVSVLGAETSNLALKVLAKGGVYLGGGIPPRILPLLDERFRAAFLNKGRFNDLLADVPIHVILNPKTALLGAANHAILNV